MLDNKSDLRRGLFIIILSLLLSIQYANGATADFWIIENPAALLLYNRYVQRLTDNENEQLTAFSAWQILELNIVLSDQYTRVIKTQQDRDVYFIQVTASGEPVNQDSAGQISTIKNAQILGDTVRISTNGRLFIKSGNKRFSLSEGMLVKRLFVHRGTTFGKTLTGQNAGWIEGNGPKNWEAFHSSSNNQAFENQLFSRIDQIFQSYNTRFNRLFDTMNQRYNEQYTPPQWIAMNSPVDLRYTLEPYDYRTRLSGTRSFLVQELTDLLYGSDYHLIEGNDQIIITKKSR